MNSTAIGRTPATSATKVDLGDLHRFAIKWALLISGVVIATGFGLGLVAIH